MINEFKHKMGRFLLDFWHSKWFGPTLLALCFFFLVLVRFQINLPTFGDEPHYLIMDSSLLKDHDLNLYNNYKDKDYSDYFTGDLPPQGSPIESKHDVRSIHGDGIPIFLLPGYALAAKTGAAVQMVMVATLVVWLVWFWTKLTTGNKALAYLAAGSMAISYFFCNLAGYIYPDIFVAAAFLSALIIIQLFYNNKKFQFILGAVLGFSVVIHFRTLILAVPAFILLTYQTWRSKQALPWVAGIAFFIFCLYYYYSTYIAGGAFAPTVGTSGASLTGNPLVNTTAMLFDSNKGLLIFNPLLLLLVVGLPIWFKQHRQSLIFAIIITLPTAATTTMFIEWHGGYAPTGRYIMSLVPVFMPALAFALSKVRYIWQKIVIGVLAIATLFITLDAMRSHFPLIDPNTWSRHRLFDHIQHATGIAVDKVMPSFITLLNEGDRTILIGGAGMFKVLFWYAVIIALFLYGLRLSQNSKTGKAARGKTL